MAKFNNPVDVWGDLHPKSKAYGKGLSKQLKDNAYNCVDGEVDLFIAIIIQAAKERDFRYLHSDQCEEHCELIGLNYVRVVRVIEKICDCLDFDLEGLEDARY